jgi:hypothetical protein
MRIKEEWTAQWNCTSHVTATHFKDLKRGVQMTNWLIVPPRSRKSTPGIKLPEGLTQARLP